MASATTNRPFSLPTGAGCLFLDLDDTTIYLPAVITSLPLLIRDRYVGLDTLRVALVQYVKHRRGEQTKQDDESVLSLVGGLIKGKDATELARLAEVAADTLVKHLIFPEAIALIEQSQRAGVRTALISSAPLELVEPLRRALGIDFAVASRGEVGEAQRFTGRIDLWNDGPTKAVSMRELAERELIDLTSSVAYGNSIRDREMLELVGTAVATNPDRKLLALAQDQGWEVLNFEIPKEQMRAYKAEMRKLLTPTAARAFAYCVVAAGTAFSGARLIGRGRDLAPISDSFGLSPLVPAGSSR